jgi:hypothetical protein
MAQSTAQLVCVECGATTAVFERGWRAYLTAAEERVVEVVAVCPACSERKFGEDEPSAR